MYFPVICSDDEKEELDRQMGELDDNQQVVDEKLWNEDEDEQPDQDEKMEARFFVL